MVILNFQISQGSDATVAATQLRWVEICITTTYFNYIEFLGNLSVEEF